MPEYIERETVIEKLNKLCDRVCQYSKAQRKYMCDACPLGDAFIVIEDDIPAADVRPVEWIPVTERLPEHDKNVLICYEWTGRSRTVYREVGIASIEELERDPTEMFRPLYWMPLPEPPKEG